MTSPIDQLLESMENLLTTGAGWVTLGVFDGDIPVYRGDAPVDLPTPHLAIAQAGPCKERHEQDSGLWEVPVFARLTLDRNGGLGDTEEEIAASVRGYADNMEAILTKKLRVNPDDEADGFSTPWERLTNDNVHVFQYGIQEVEVDADTEMDADPVCEVRFTAFCAHAALIIPTA